MRFDVSPFNKIRPRAIRLTPWRRSTPPRSERMANPVGAVVELARYIGLKEIPAATMEVLRDHPYFRYCFYILNTPSAYVPAGEGLLNADCRRLALLLKYPAAMTDNDVERGLEQYLNNFPAYLPGGYKHKMFKSDPEMTVRGKQIAAAVEEVVANRGLTDQVLAARGPKGQPDSLELLKLALEIFHVLVNERHFDPRDLWR